MASTYNLPKVTATKSLTKYEIEKDEWSTVEIIVKGDTKIQQQPYPSAVVLAIDYSNSMETNDAYKDASAAAKDVVDLLQPGIDKLGIITIQTHSDWAVPLTGLTAANKVTIKQKIDSFGPGGYTNYQEAFDKANAVLAAETALNKFVVFMSDGVPQPDMIAQQNYIHANRFVPAAAGIKYFTIEFGPANQLPNVLLDEMASCTGGQYQKISSQTTLSAAFKAAVKEGQTSFVTESVEIEETVSNKLKIRPGSLSVGTPPAVNDPGLFAAATKAAEIAFYQNHKLKIPPLHQLAGGENFTITFDVTVDTCGDGDSVFAVDDPYPASRVIYQSGGKQDVAMILPQQDLKVLKCDIHLEKAFDVNTQTVNLTVRNDYPRPITNVLILEVTSQYFHPGEPTSPAHDLLGGNQVRWGDIHTNKIELQPGETRTYDFRLIPQPGTDGQNGPYEIDYVRASTQYTVDYFQFAIEDHEPGYIDFANDLQTHIVSAATSQWLADWFANKPDPDKSGLPLGLSFNVPGGTQLMVLLGMPGQPPPEFGWIVPATAGSSMIKIRQENNQIRVFRPTLRLKRFPQAYTPFGFP